MDESISLMKPSNRERAKVLLAECKKREAKTNLFAWRKDRSTVVLISREKAIKMGLIENANNRDDKRTTQKRTRAAGKDKRG